MLPAVVIASVPVPLILVLVSTIALESVIETALLLAVKPTVPQLLLFASVIFDPDGETKKIVPA